MNDASACRWAQRTSADLGYKGCRVVVGTFEDVTREYSDLPVDDAEACRKIFECIELDDLPSCEEPAISYVAGFGTQVRVASEAKRSE